MKFVRLLPGLHCFRDICNVYVVHDKGEAVAIDFGSGGWLRNLSQLGIKKLSHVFLTHSHEDQCRGLPSKSSRPFLVHAPVGEDRFLSPQGVRDYWRSRRRGGGCPSSYSVLKSGVAGIRYDTAGFSDFFWGNRRIRFISTPGHGAGALSVVMDLGNKQIVFCGDAAHERGTIWQPYHLEWDHWTGTGALAAWEGIQRLAHLGIDLLCPAHGPMISKNPRRNLKLLGQRLMRFYQAKGSICSGEHDRYLTPEIMKCGARRILPHLIQFGMNSYLLRSDSGEALVVDPMANDLCCLDGLLKELNRPRLTAVLVTHYHLDHCDGAPFLQKKHGAAVWLHPRVAVPLRNLNPLRFPWLPRPSIKADHFWPERGSWRWNEHGFQIAPFGGQTWWHCAFLARIDGRRVLFGGDNFQPASRWNGTGGFCSFNGSRFREGFMRSAKLALQWRPDLVVTGHQNFYRFSPRHFRKIISWAGKAEAATRALCPSGNLERDYYLHHVK